MIPHRSAGAQAGENLFSATSPGLHPNAKVVAPGLAKADASRACRGSQRCSTGPVRDVYTLYPRGFCSCQRQWSAHIRSMPNSARQPSSFAAAAGSA